MRKFSSHISRYKQLGYQKRAKKLVVLIWGLLIIIGILIYIDNRLNKNQIPVDSSQNVLVDSTNTIVFAKPYFQFQADQSWQEITSESTQNKFIYRQKNGPLILGELTVTINPLPEDLAASRVLPASITPAGKFEPEKVSQHCQKLIKSGSLTQKVQLEFEDTSFLCNPDTGIFSVVVAQVGGSSLLHFKGKNYTLGIFYRELTANPSGSPLAEILKTFQVL